MSASASSSSSAQRPQLPIPPDPLIQASSSASPFIVTIRFTTSLPDLTLTLATPTLTTNTLQHLIRARRPTLANRRLRLIHSGKVLPPNSPLAQLLITLQCTLPPPSPSAKGKEKEPDPATIWIHCSVGDTISASELAAEYDGLESAIPNHLLPYQQQQSVPLQPPPQGFDRLLSSGFTEAEVAMLRAQFMRLNPDLDPAGDDIRAMEERWIDESVAVGGPSGGGGAEAATTAYEDMFTGTVIGFFWPATLWLAREDGVFTPRRQMAIVAGVCVNIFFGMVRAFG